MIFFLIYQAKTTTSVVNNSSQESGFLSQSILQSSAGPSNRVIVNNASTEGESDIDNASEGSASQLYVYVNPNDIHGGDEEEEEEEGEEDDEDDANGKDDGRANAGVGANPGVGANDVDRDGATDGDGANDVDGTNGGDVANGGDDANGVVDDGVPVRSADGTVEPAHQESQETDPLQQTYPPNQEAQPSTSSDLVDSDIRKCQHDITLAVIELNKLRKVN